MKFETKTVLSITHDKLLTCLADVHKILSFMTGQSLFTHQLPDAKDFCQPYLLQQHPQLEQWNEFDPQINTFNFMSFIEKAEELFGKHLEVAPLPQNVWTKKDPIKDLQDKMGKDKVIVVEFGNQSEPPICLN